MGRLGLLAFIPLVAFTAYAGFRTDPEPISPCVTEVSRGLHDNAGPGGLTVDSEGTLWASSGTTGDFLRLDPSEGRVKQYKAPPGVSPHDPFPRSDGTIWFSDVNGGLVEFDPRTERFTVFTEDIAPGSEPHGIVWARDDRLYMAEQQSGLFKRFDPRTKRIVTVTDGMPPDSGPHGILEVGERHLWVAFQFADQIGRFDIRSQRFDKLVDFPADSGPHQIAYDPKREQLVVTLQHSQQIGLYDLANGDVRVFDTDLDPVSRKVAVSRKARDQRVTTVAVDAAARYAWITTLAPGILRFDLDTHETKSVTCGVTLPSAGLVAIRAGRDVWFSEPFPGAFARVDEDDRGPVFDSLDKPQPAAPSGPPVEAEDALHLEATVGSGAPHSSLAHTIKLTRLVRTEVEPPAAQTVVRLPEGARARVDAFPQCRVSQIQQDGPDSCPPASVIGRGRGIAGAGPFTLDLDFTFYATSVDRNPDGSPREPAQPGFVGAAESPQGPLVLPFVQVAPHSFATDKPQPGDKAKFVIITFELSIPARTENGIALIESPPVCTGTWRFSVSEIPAEGRRLDVFDDVPCESG